MQRILTQRRFGWADQLAFAELSGDYNPLHIDPVAARRYMFGEPVVHGMNLLLWALDEWVGGGHRQVCLKTLSASFVRPVVLDQTVELAFESREAGRLEMEICTRDSAAARVALTFEPDASSDLPTNRILDALPPRRESRVLTVDDIEDLRGEVPLYLERSRAERLFPNATRRLGGSSVATLLATTRLVGVECPGLHSLYSSLDLEFLGGNDAAEIGFKVARTDRRIGLVDLQLSSTYVRGRIKAFLRPAPLEQPPIATLAASVAPGEYRAQRALIMGGSRGLGEVAAKLLAAGGADVVITYHKGKDDARRIIEEINAFGGTASCAPLDVLSPYADLAAISARLPTPTHCYYFASPFIFSGVKGVFSAALFEKFAAYYVTGFARTLSHWRGLGVKHFFYPSTVALEELPIAMGEYAAAKTAGETLCAFLEKSDPDLTIYRPRLPRAATDQTVSLLPVKNCDPAELMSKELLCFKARCSRGA